MDELKQDDQLEHTYSSYVRIRDVAQKFCQRRRTIGKTSESGSGYECSRHDMMMNFRELIENFVEFEVLSRNF